MNKNNSTENKWLKEFNHNYPKLFVEGDDWNWQPDIVNFIKEVENQSRQEERERTLQEAVDIIEDVCTWYNTNNQIPDSELGKSDKHWKMLQNLVKNSLKEVSERIIKDLTSLQINQ